MSKLVRGDRLPSNLRREVLASYIYRWTSDNTSRDRAWRGIKGAPTIPLVSDDQWLREHAFYVTDRGTLDKRKKHAEPVYMVDDKSTVKKHHATKKSPAQLQRDIDAALARSDRYAPRMVMVKGRLVAPHGYLTNYKTGEQLRPATADEARRSRAAAKRDGGPGVIKVDGLSTYVA